MAVDSLPSQKRFLLFASAALLLLCRADVRAERETSPSFVREIRPILSENCFRCHGPDDAAREAGLRLDREQSALAEADSGLRAIVPGEADESELLVRILSDDESVRMPPPEVGSALQAEEVELLRTWIEQGASWQRHWSLIPPKRPALPAVQRDDWPSYDLDYFVLSRLEREGLTPSPPADRETLLRRVTLDLSGLPPTLSEMDAFLADSSPDAYEKVVDRLLASRRYGEHMARYWLDAARYGDTHGLHLDNYREIWPYRDWVINAFNHNLPFDQFITDQLAGDLSPDPSDDQLIATGFNRCHVTTNEGGSIEEEVYVRNVVDRVVTFGTVFLGMTLDCTRCHDHKYDPVTMDDFYSLFAYFNSLDGSAMDGNRKDHAPVKRVASKDEVARLTRYQRDVEELEATLKADWSLIDAQQRHWEEQLRSVREEPDSTQRPLALGDWYFVGPFKDVKRYLFKREHGPEARPGKAIRLDDSFTLETGESITWQHRPDWVDGKVHGDLPQAVSASFLYRRIDSPDERKVAVTLGSNDAIKLYLNGQKVLSNDVNRTAAADQERVELELAEGENHLLMKIVNYGGAAGFYFQVASGTIPVPEKILSIAKLATSERSAEQSAKLQEFYRFKVSHHAALKLVREQLAESRTLYSALDAKIPTTLIWREKSTPQPAHLLIRGEYDQKGDERPRATPAVLPTMKEEWPNDRLGLARWVVDRDHPLTARVAVNRFWQQLFGTGIVRTAEDFGSQGELPSHPMLLDKLATDLIDDAWDVKSLMKRMVMSATYRQSSQVTPECLERDPDNRLLARGPRFRLDAEVIRDQALAVSGLLVEKLGGPSVKPPQPDGLWFAVGYSGSNTVRFEADQEPDKVYRRTLYTFIKRTAPPPQMSTFDGPSREACCVRRERTNTPLQQLLLANDPQFVEAARALALRAWREASDTDPQRATRLLRFCTARWPQEAEIAELVEAVHADTVFFKEHQQAAQELVFAGKTPSQPVDDVAELAAWTLAANLVLSLDEVVTKQ